MNLKQARYKNGRVWLSVVKKYWKDGVSKTRTVKRIGWLDELERDYDDPIAHFQAYAKELTEREQAEVAAKHVAIHPLEKINTRTVNRKNLGFCALSSIYHGLGIDTFFKNHQRHRNFGYSTDAITRLLVYDRILHPSSKKEAFEEKDSYFETFKFSIDDVYRSLSHIACVKDALIAHLNHEVGRLYGRSKEVVYYDVTNYYFEIDAEDGFKKKGVSKEHRPDPIVAMGLLVDSTGLPVAYELYPGNTLDCKTLIGVLERIKGSARKEFGFGRVVAVADKGINTSDNIVALLGRGDGYVFSQSVRGASAELLRWVTDDTGYLSSDVTDAPVFKVKSRITERTLNVTVKEATGRTRRQTKRVKITEKQVAFWSAKYAARAQCDRARALEKAQNMVTNPPALKALIDHTAAKYVRGITIDDNGVVIETKNVLFFDHERLLREESLDGYYIISTSEIEKSDTEIIEMYRGLWRIEETFRVTKSDLAARPVFVSRKDHIEAHFLICFVALLIIRILQLKTEWKYSAHALATTLKDASGSYFADNWYLFDHRDKVLDDIGTVLDLDFTKKNLTRGDIRTMVGSTKKRLA